MAVPKCFCGDQVVVKISWRDSSPGRHFYGCCKYGGRERSCNFFKWFDEALEEHYHHVMVGLLRKLRDKDEEIKKVRRRSRNGLWLKIFVVFLIGLVCGILSQ